MKEYRLRKVRIFPRKNAARGAPGKLLLSFDAALPEVSIEQGCLQVTARVYFGDRRALEFCQINMVDGNLILVRREKKPLMFSVIDQFSSELVVNTEYALQVDRDGSQTLFALMLDYQILTGTGKSTVFN